MNDKTNFVEEVKLVNERFYVAFESLEMAEMSQVWAHDDNVVCIHPGWQIRRGWDYVRSSWEAIFRNTDYIEFKITDVDVSITEQCAWVVCVENLRSAISGDVTSTRVLATNIYVRRDNVWLMVHHHSSPIFSIE